MIPEDALWPGILSCRDFVRVTQGNAPQSKNRATARSWSFDYRTDTGWRFNHSNQTVKWSVTERSISCDLHSSMPADFARDLGLCSRYIQLLIKQYQWTASRPVMLASVAQSLDGFIATQSGDSQWIGNEQNLLHAHRLRALHDGILVGRRTLERDRPALNVRKVAGDDPRRIAVTTQSPLSDALLDALVAPTIVLMPHAVDSAYTCSHHFVEALYIDRDKAEQQLCVQSMLAALWQQGVRSVLIEGGGRTLSSIYRHGALDGADLQIAPILLGDGISAIDVAPVAALRDAPVHTAQVHSLDGQALMCVDF